MLIMVLLRATALVAACALLSGGVAISARTAAVPPTQSLAPHELDLVSATDALDVQRAAGSGRVATSVAASRDFRDAAQTAVLATADGYADALAATALAGRLDAPLLLTHTEAVPDSILAELDRLGVQRIVLLGGTSAIGQSVAANLGQRGYQVTRVAGSNRFATAGEVARVGAVPDGEVLLALGAHPDPERAWSDAVASSALSATDGGPPTLLTAHHRLPSATRQALRELDVQRVVVVGGAAAIPDKVVAQVEQLGLDTRRLAGASRYATSRAVTEAALARRANDDDPHPLVLATGERYPDALAAGALANALDATLALTASDRLARPIDELVRAHHDTLTRGVLVGGRAAASEAVVDQLKAALSDVSQLEPNAGAPVSDNDSSGSQGSVDDQPGEEVTATFQGTASWYGAPFHGNETACGEVFDMHELTAAHRQLPCGTRVRVTNPDNGGEVTVRINDRGPHAAGRVLDLSRAAAEAIGIRTTGTGRVRGEVLAE
jgi:putative cell wall-binding protein